MKHSQPHMYWAVILLIWGGNMIHKDESLIMMLSYASLDSFSPPFSCGTTMISCSSMTDTLNNKFGISCGPD